MRFPRTRPSTILQAEADIVRRIAAFATVSDAALLELARASRNVEFETDDVMISQGEPSAFALILLSGAVTVVNQSQHGEVRVAQIAAPALVGEIGALAHLRRTASVRAASPVSALLIERETLLDIGGHAPALLVSVIGQLGQQIQNINSALGLYAAGFFALGRDDFDPAVLTDLNNPSEECRRRTLRRHDLCGCAASLVARQL